MIVAMTGKVALAIWVSQMFYFIGFIPQIILNYRLKSARGLSDLYIFAFFNGYLADIYYIFCLDFPIQYRIMIPVCAVAIGIIVLQRFYYGAPGPARTRLAFLYLTNIAIFMAVFPYAVSHTHLVGHIAGWVTTLIWSTYQLPQIIKLLTQRSVQGFSFALTTMCALAALLEGIAALILGLPSQTLINTGRGVLFYFIFCVQFLLFGR